MGLESYLKCWIKEREGEENDQRRIYVGDVPFITSSVGCLNEVSSQEHPSEDFSPAATSSSEYGTSTEQPKDPEVTSPSIHLNKGSDPSQDITSRNLNFPNNRITSSRYTIWNFFFKNLYEQFSRIVNLYFLCVAILQTVIDSPVSPVTALAPLVFVIAVTMIKQGYEDYLRHNADASVNNRQVQVVRNQEIVMVRSKDVKVGDVLKLDLDDQVPTDLLLLASSDDYHRCQINTANLDGETNLKMRYCPSGLYHFQSEEDFSRLHVIVECEQPNADLYVFNGNLLIPSDKMSKTAEVNVNTNVDADRPRQAVRRSSTTRRVSKSYRDNVHEEDNPVSDFLQIPLSMDNVVLRGTRLKNTDYIFGLVVYTGEDTRLAQNSKNAAPKHSSVEKTVTKYLVAFMFALVFMVALASTLHYTVEWLPENSWYIMPAVEENTFGSVFNLCTSFLILFNYIIPISLSVTIELQKFVGSQFFVWDVDMASDNGSPPLCNTSDLNEELGQLEYLFSDKTGTLTENIMKFRYCSINEKTYVFDDDKLYLRNDEDNTNTVVDISENETVRKFLTVLALCHTVQLMPIKRASIDSTAGAKGIANKLKKKKKKISSKLKNASSLFSLEDKPPTRFSISNGGQWEYQASSPDEKALLEACSQLEVIYYGEKEDILSVEICGKKEFYKRHYILEFDADRKCMSVIVENDKGEIILLTKGAETAIIPNSDDGSVGNIDRKVLDFAMMGLRTLVVAERKLTRDELNEFSVTLKRNRRLIKNREAKMRELYRSTENHLTILGATGVEDQLQAGVPETLQALGAAGIRVWMLTGDKVETGVNVAVACGLITASSKQIFLTNHTDEAEVKRRLAEIQYEMEDGDNTTFVIDGMSLATAFNCCPDILCKVTMKSFRVVCCRMAPLQKAQVVQMVKKTPRKPVTAAVGDGANDVAMIQEAHLGIGILGKEGRQAARCSDFAVGKFCFLKKAILVHGHWYYYRLSILANYFFYKNFLFVLPQIFFCFNSAFSSQALFEGIFLMMYNIFFTSLPIFVFGLLDQNYSAKVLLRQPHLYKRIRRNAIMSWTQFKFWLLAAFWHAGVCYYIPYLAWSFFQPVSDFKSFGTVVFCCLVAVGNMKMAIETKLVTWFYVGSQCFSYCTMFLFTALYSELNSTFLNNIGFDAGMFGHVYFTVLSSLPFYITLACVLMTALLPDMLYIGLRTSWPKVKRFWKNVPKKLKLGHESIFRLPQFTLLFNKGKGKPTVSNGTVLTSYQSKQDLHHI